MKKFKTLPILLIQKAFNRSIDPNTNLGELKSKGNSRRKFMKNGALASMGIVIGGSQLISSCNLTDSGSKELPVAILGGGIAGLHAGYLLSKSKIDFRIFESSKRLGGRIFTRKDLFSKGTTTELGGEFIDSNHEDMLKLADEFKLELLDIDSYVKNKKLKKDNFYFKGKTLTEEEVITAFIPYSKKIGIDVKLVNEDDEKAIQRLDQMSIDEYLASVGVTGWLFEFITTAYTAEYGIESKEQSSLNMLYMLNPDTSEGLSVYGESDERYRIKGGNEKLIEKISEKIDDKILKDCHCVSITENNGLFQLQFKNGEVFSAKFLIVAIPFTALRKIDIRVPMSEDKKKAIQELGYGTNSKLFLGYKDRPWNNLGYSGGVFNSEIYNGWETTQMQESIESVYTVFVGGDSGKNMSELKAEKYVDTLNSIFPDSKKSWLQQKTVFNWSTSSLVEGSYSAYRKGQWTTISGMEKEPVGNMFFAGEHCSEDFQGYMNGGAETGRLAAEAIMEKLAENKKG